jgi:hypothetical protein
MNNFLLFEDITLGGQLPPFLRGQFYRFYQYSDKIFLERENLERVDKHSKPFQGKAINWNAGVG